MVKPRRRTDFDPAEEKRIEMFAAQAEQPRGAVAEPVVRAVPDIPEADEPAPLPQPVPQPVPQPSASLPEAEPEDLPDEEAPAQDDPQPAAAKAAPKSSPRRKASPSPRTAPSTAAWKRRNQEPKNGGINFRASASQLDLLRMAAAVEEISQQKVLERLVWPILEDRYGRGTE